jgi:hypothetical protein
MGYSPCFLSKNDRKWIFLASPKLIENNSKGVKMTQNGSKPWAFWPKMTENACFFTCAKIKENNLKGVKMAQIDQKHGQ